MSNQDKPVVELVGNNGNAFAIIGACKKAARKAGWDKERISEFVDEMHTGDYDNLLVVAMKYFEVE